MAFCGFPPCRCLLSSPDTFSTNLIHISSMNRHYTVYRKYNSAACGSAGSTKSAAGSTAEADTGATTDDRIKAIESALDISENDEITWSYDEQSDSWTMSVTSAVVNPEIEDEQGVSVNIPGAYVDVLFAESAARLAERRNGCRHRMAVGRRACPVGDLRRFPLPLHRSDV